MKILILYNRSKTVVKITRSTRNELIICSTTFHHEFGGHHEEYVNILLKYISIQELKEFLEEPDILFGYAWISGTGRLCILTPNGSYQRTLAMYNALRKKLL